MRRDRPIPQGSPIPLRRGRGNQEEVLIDALAITPACSCWLREKEWARIVPFSRPHPAP